MALTVAAAKNKFLQLDKEGTGTLSQENLFAFLKKGDASITLPDVELIFKQIDKAGDGVISLTEFVDYITNFSSGWEDLEKEPDHKGWIPSDTIQTLLTQDLKFLIGIDGSPISNAALNFLCDREMAINRNSSVCVVHVTDRNKTYLPPSMQPDAVKSVTESKLIGSLSSKRYRMNWIEKGNDSAGSILCEQIKSEESDFCILGYFGRKGKKDGNMVASNVYGLLKHGRCSTVVMKREDTFDQNRNLKFVVHAKLDKASMKAFLDALRLSSPGDTIDVIYCVNFAEKKENIYTDQLKKKYHEFFESLGSADFEGFSKFQDRKLEFHIITKERSETVPGRITRYLDETGADFVSVGTNRMRVERGKEPVGSISMQICQEADCNYIVSFWVGER